MMMNNKVEHLFICYIIFILLPQFCWGSSPFFTWIAEDYIQIGVYR